ncbi:hypothetical protein JDV02_002522 [Purpureocillium takamizusanense]|uniref:Uncharacterized protein n=1 Tax=Purpureocillium takamizusanense TaxID=2060973 RepID=A0A9Q8QB75_9HYPO|nr:uncharacterized protein JDV02_002522 [Purpureocillium takamizusanense]UNI16046.1 hypothetical protein JDV02_002522 [Purpureocillium takamizusanense]
MQSTATPMQGHFLHGTVFRHLEPAPAVRSSPALTRPPPSQVHIASDGRSRLRWLFPQPLAKTSSEQKEHLHFPSPIHSLDPAQPLGVCKRGTRQTKAFLGFLPFVA